MICVLILSGGLYSANTDSVIGIIVNFTAKTFDMLQCRQLL